MNPHTEQITQYANDWKETPRPWERWEFDAKDGAGWSDLVGDHPTWDPGFEYRRKPIPEFILVNGVKVPAPYKDDLRLGTTYFMPDPADAAIPCLTFTHPARFLTGAHKLGLVHTTKIAAIEHAAAMRLQLPFTE